MLSLAYNPERLRKTENLIPTRTGALISRPGAIQVIEGEVSRARPWGNRILMERDGRIVLWDGITEYDIDQAGTLLDATPYQALIGDAQREDRLYIADGISPLSYIHRDGTPYSRVNVLNTILDESGAPYPIEVPSIVTTWKSRVFIGWGTNRLRHCQAEAPEEWDPLWTQELQGKDPGRVLSIDPNGEALLCGLTKSIWQITGDSQFNWERTPIIEGSGVIGPRALDGDTNAIYWLSEAGLHQSGVDAPISGDIEDIFATSQFGGEVLVDSSRRLVLILLYGRIFVMHKDKPGLFGEIDASAYGLIRLDDYIGWYGSNGVWLLGDLDEPDIYLDGTRSDVVSIYETWDVRPNKNGNRRAALPRVFIETRGSQRDNATYSLAVDGSDFYSNTFSLTDQEADTWQSEDMTSLVAMEWPSSSVLRELVPRAAGEMFRHTITAPCHIEIDSFDPQYIFGGDD